jgi:hypothetical protein
MSYPSMEVYVLEMYKREKETREINHGRGSWFLKLEWDLFLTITMD